MCAQRVAFAMVCFTLHILFFVIVVLHKLFVFSTKLHIGIKKKIRRRPKSKRKKSEKWSAMSLKFRNFLRFAFSTILFLCSYMMVVNRMLTPNHERSYFSLLSWLELSSITHLNRIEKIVRNGIRLSRLHLFVVVQRFFTLGFSYISTLGRLKICYSSQHFDEPSKINQKCQCLRFVNIELL